MSLCVKMCRRIYCCLLRESLGSFDKRVPEGRLDLYIAVMGYEATESDGLSFKEGDTIEVCTLVKRGHILICVRLGDR